MTRIERAWLVAMVKQLVAFQNVAKLTKLESDRVHAAYRRLMLAIPKPEDTN